MTCRNRNIALVGAVLPMLASNLHAANKTWAAAVNGDWTNAAAWNLAGVPVNGDTVLINTTSASNYLIDYDNPSTIQTFPLLTLNNTGGGAAQMRTGGGTVYNITNGIVGDNGRGQWQIGVARANVGSLNVGSQSTGVGTVTLSTGTLDIAGGLRIGRFGVGQLTQTNGVVSADLLSLGSEGAGNGTYLMNGGALNLTNALAIGPSGSGHFSQTNGNITANSLITGGTGEGHYALSGGSASVNLVQVGNSLGDGSINISGGSLNVNSGSMLVGNGGAGSVTQSGGQVSVTNQLIIANVGGSGMYDLQGGALDAGSIVINSGGTFSYVNGAPVTANAATLNAGGTWVKGAGAGGLIGTFNHNGGVVASGFFNNSTSTYIYNSGTFNGRMDTFGTVTLNADMTMGDGLRTRMGGATTFTIPAARTLTLNGQGLDHGANTIFLFGVLNSTTSSLGGATVSGDPVFAHQSGTHNVSNELRIGDGLSAGTYNLNAGTLNMAAATVGASVGLNQPGLLNIVNGRANISHLRVGNGAAGTVNHNGAGDLVATNITVGSLSAGTYLQNSAGATVNASNGLIIGALGRYNLTNGTLTAAQTSNNGSFTQVGGFANLNQVSGTGRMDITNTASLTVDRIRNDFLFVADTARIFTTANGGANGVSRLNTLFFEDFENLNFFGKWDLNNNDLVIDSDTGTQADEYDRTKRYIQSGFGFSGNWTGNGLNSSAAIAAAATTNKTGLGYARAADVLSFSGGTATFVGQTVDDTTVLVRYTLLGDGDLDGTVDITDFAFLASNFNTPGDWHDGDFTYDFQVNISDFALLASNFNKALAGDLPRGVAVPEPSIAAIVGVIALTARKRR